MSGRDVMELFERGEASGIETTILVVRIRGAVFVSFDGEEWAESKSEFINKQLD